MKIKDILSNDEIFELQKNQGKSTDEILQIARDRYKEQLASGEIARKEQAELEYQKRNDLNAIKELNALKKEAIDKGASGAEIEQLQNNYNIMRYGTPEQKKQLEQAQNAVKIKQEIIDEAAKNDEKYGGFSGGASRSLQKAWGNTLVGIGEAAKYLGIDSERLKRGTDYYKNAVEYLNDIDKSRQKQGLKTFSEDAGNFVGAIGGPGEVATLPFGFGKTALRTAGKFAGIELLGGTPRRIGESVTEPNSNLGFLEKSALESGLAGGFGGLLHGGYNLYKGLKGAKGAETAPNSSTQTAPNTAPNTQNSSTEDLATNGVWLDYGNTAPQNGGLLRGDNFVTDPNSANVEQKVVANFELAPNVRDLTKISTDEISADLSHLSEKHPEMFEKASDVFKLIKEIKDEPQFFYRNNRLDGALIAKRLQEQGKIGKVVVNKENGEVIHATKAREQDLARLERVANKNDERVRALSTVSSRKVEQGGGLPSETIPQHPLNTADDIDLVPDENGVYQVAYNGSSKELAKIATEIAKGDPQSMGAKRLVYIADNIAETAAKDAEQKISANIAKIDDDSVELYANNTALLGDIAKKYPMLNKDEQIELANKQILANASAELIEYSKFLNGGKLPNDARLLGKNLGRMILKSLNAGASKQEIIDMLLKAGISGRNSTAAKALIQTGDINAYNAVMRKAEAELIAELSGNVRVAAKNESIGAILDSAKAKALENDELLKKGVGNQGLDDVINTFKSSKSGKEFEVAENGFGRELLSYDGVAANEEMKRAFLAWEAQEKKADITLNDGRKVVFLEPDEAVQLSYGNSYLYGEKDFEALFARKQAESLEQKLKRLQSHPAYENLLKMRENTKASELKGDTFGGSKPTVFYEPQSERYLRTQGGGGLPNAERSITITKADVAKLRAGKADAALATKLENNLEALTGDPVASGVIDELLTRDYHLASAAKKSELVAPKNADEIAGNSRIPSDLLDKTKPLRKAEKNELTDELIQEVIKNDSKLWIENASDEVNAFISSKNTKITAKGSAIKHTLERHGKNSINAKNGQPPISLDDIKNHADIVNTADKRVFSTDKSGHKVLVSGKQINGYYVVVENVSNKTGELKFKTMYKENGKLENNEYFKNSAVLNQQYTGAKSFGASPNNHLDQAFGTNVGNSTLKEIKSQGGGGLKRGFSTQALNELMLGLGSGSANAMAEDDPNKKAEAFIKGFLAGFGGAKAAKILAKNAPKLAPQLARASEKMASDFPRLLNDRPDILGGVLGRMNNAKDKFSFIFGGEKALGANKAKLEKARDMAKNGAKDDEIWAKTGWYKDIDGKWKFEINPKGGELNKSAFDNHMAKEKAIEKEISELEKTIDDWENTTAKERVEAREKIDELTQSKNKLSIKLGDFLDDEALYKAYPQFKDTTIKFTSIDGDLGTSFGGKILLNKNMDIAQMKSVLYHELQHEVQYVEDFGVGGTGYFDKAKIKELVEKHPNDTQLKQLYDEIENGWAVDEDNAFNVYQKLAGEAEARNVQARQAMLEKADKEAGRIISMIKDPQKAMRISKDLANVDEYVMLKAGNKATGAEHIKLRHTSDPNKTGYVSDDEISRLGENMRKFIIKHGEPYFNKENGNFVYEWVENGNAFGLITNSRSLSKPDIFNPTSKTLRAPATDSRSLQLAPFNHTGTPAKDEIITFYSNRNLKTNGAYKFTNPELTWQKASLPNSQLPHPDKTLDIAPNERIVSFDDGASASYTPKQKEMRGVYNVAFNEKRATQIYKDIEDVENTIKFEKGRADNISANKDGFGSLHIKKHLDPKNEGYITTQEYLNMGEYIRKAGDFKESGGKRVYDYTDENGVRFRAIIGDTRGGKDRVISFFSDRKAGSAYDRQNYTRNQPLNENSTTSSLKSQELSMRESFSPELKASYDMRDKLLKSTNEVRASLNEKGKAELEKLLKSKDSKLSRDAQIMKTLENAKSNPARYAKLKKLYLDENGKVKDSIGLC